MDSSMERMKNSLLAARYLLPNETIEEFNKRIIDFVTTPSDNGIKFSKDEKNDLTVLLTNGSIIFNSPLLMNAGKEQALASACYVLPVIDSLVDDEGSIMDLQKLSAKIFKLGAGVGVDYSLLRPEGINVNSGGTASGPTSFMLLIDTLAEVVKSGGKRRAAIMSTLRIDHPDIEKFINVKKNNKTMQNTNISIMMTNNFMDKVVNDIDSNIDILNLWGNGPTDGPTDGLSVKKLWDMIVDNAWTTGDPGLVFIDVINNTTNGVTNQTYTGVNACSEFSLYPYESCLIGTINVSKCLQPDNQIDYEKLNYVTGLLVKCLDNVIDIAWYPDTKIKQQAHKYRRVGVGITGLGDTLIKMNVSYDTDKALTISKDIMSTINKNAIEMSEELANTYGAFPQYSKFKPGSYYTPGSIVKPRRNLAVTVIAPTGSTSILCGAECSGIEPMYAVAYKRMMRLDTGGNTWFDVVSPLFIEKMKALKFTDADIKELIPKIIANNGSVQTLAGIPDSIKQIFKTAHEVEPINHLKMVANLQPYVENAISKTINIPYTSTRDEVASLYIKAWEMGCKGITVFRDGCKNEQVYSTAVDVNTHTKEVRPDILTGQTIRMSLPQGSLYINVTIKDNKPFELFAILGKSGLDQHAYCEAMGRLISLSLRSGISVERISKSLKGIRGRDWGMWGEEYIWSVPHALGIALDYAVKNSTGILKAPVKDVIQHCPECGGKMVSDNGCMKCLACEYSKCSS